MHVLIADPIAAEGVELLSRHHQVDVKTGLPKQDLVGLAGSYDAIVVRSQTTIDADILAAGAGRLKVVARAGVGLDNVDVEAATRHGIVVCNAPQSNIVSAAEHTVALLLAVARNIPQAHTALTDGRWERSSWTGTEVQGKVLGILGLGRIGTLVAQRCHAFGMHLAAYDPFVAPEHAARLGVDLHDTIEEVLALADFVTVHLPKTPDTLGLIDTAMLARMKPTARLLNVARGSIVDEDALAEALRKGTIAGAAIDVFATEPATDSPLFALPNVVVTPHLGASTAEAQDRAAVQVAEYVELALAGDFVPSAVNVPGGPVNDLIRPYLPLAEKLGRLVTGLAGGGLDGEVTVECAGELADEDCSILGLTALRGVLAATSDEPVTLVNTPGLAEGRGLHLKQITTRHSEAHPSSHIRVTVHDRDGQAITVGGSLHPAHRERLIEVWSTPVDVEPTRHMAFLRYRDRPGIIGVIGSILAEEQVNIASAQIGRSAPGGDAVMVLCLDQPVSRPTLAAAA
ncbi:MAG: phosphoglycerate dehydrogenase, partial [Nitriliruptoraceae bacterium]